jgi:hypothetical protein
MAIWRDPLDELVADLERVVPATAPEDFYFPPVADFQFWLDSLLAEDPAVRQRLAQDPRVQRVQAHWDARAREREEREAREKNR